MATSTVLAEIQAAAEPLMPVGTAFLVGRELVAGEDAPPRVVFAYGPTDEFDAAWNARVAQAAVPRVLLTRRASVEAYLWGENYDQAEAMVNAMVAALYQVALGSMAIVGGAWADVGFVTAGRAYRLSFTLDIPITEALPRTGTATSAPTDVALTT
jgi:hypothetical protein